jgi:hypothetical protein
MTKTIEITLYQFDELPAKAKEKAANYYLEHWMLDDWYECTIEHMKEEGDHKHGFRVDDIRFSGFWSQGDGASWCGAVDLGDWVRKTFNSTDLEHPLTQIFLALLEEGWIESKVLVSFSSSLYCHEKTMHVNSIDHYHRIDDGSVMEMGMLKGAQVADLITMLNCEGGYLRTLDERLKDDCEAFARTIYRELEADYNAQTTEEAIGEVYACNDVWFDESGRIA